jgi:acyl-coenzyme A synthetase/AMP-(fatty) acid ligase
MLPRAIICVENPWDFIPQLKDYSIMIINPNSPESRLKYLMDRADWSLLITKNGEQYRDGGRYDEKLFWYTNGTTSDSKFYSFSQTQLDIMCNVLCKTYDISPNDRYTSVMPIWHAHGQGFYWAALSSGCEMKFLSMKDIKNLPENDPTFITAIPDAWKVIGKFNFKSLRFIRSSSAPLPDTMYQELKEKFKVPFIGAMGMTEALGHCFTNPLYGEQRIGTIGLPDGIEAKIEDGQLYISGPTMFTREWYNTGDIAEQDEAGYYRVIGRSKDQINVKGMKLNPGSLEKQVLKHFPNLKECVIFGQDCVKCLYVGDASIKAISDFLSGLGTICRPKFIQSVEKIPTDSLGKTSRKLLDTQFK